MRGVGPTGYVGPVDFEPYRSRITDCHCTTCRWVSQEVRLYGGSQARAAYLLAQLHTGRHVHVSWEAYIDTYKTVADPTEQGSPK